MLALAEHGPARLENLVLIPYREPVSSRRIGWPHRDLGTAAATGSPPRRSSGSTGRSGSRDNDKATNLRAEAGL